MNQHHADLIPSPNSKSAMPTANAAVNSAIIAQTALNTLQAKFPLLGQIATGNKPVIERIIRPV